MRKRTIRYIIWILWVFIAFPLWAQKIDIQPGLNAISVDKIKKQLFYLSSDEMKGRNTPSPELDTCAAYIAREFAKCGLKPVGDSGSYFQHFNLLKTRLAHPNTFKLLAENQEIKFEIKSDFVPISLTANRKISGDIVFAGYGITAPEFKYDDYAGLDVNGKIVFVFTHEPQENDSTSVFNGTKMTAYSRIENKATNAQKHGAVGIIIVTDPNNHRFRRPPNSWPSLFKRAPKGVVPLSLEEKTENKIVAVRIGKDLAQALLTGSGKTLSGLQTLIDSSLQPQSFELVNKKVIMETNLVYIKLLTQNVIGLYEGADPVLKDEIVVIGGHYDHLGVHNDSIIYNGADDNASGAVGVMTVARAFAAMKYLPKRSVLFCTWAGEEKGLFGSRFYVNNSPIFPLKNTIANINLDMIGRNDSSRVWLGGYISSPDLKPIVDKANEGVGLKIDERKGIGGSDHAPFYHKEIPVLGFNTGLHEDYHKPTDTADKCYCDGMAQICKLVFKIAWQLVENDKRPQ